MRSLKIVKVEVVLTHELSQAEVMNIHDRPRHAEQGARADLRPGSRLGPDTNFR